MLKQRQLVKATKKFFKQFNKYFLTAIKKQLVWLLRTLFITRRRPDKANAGFVLPTVVMVSIVVVLLTTAILFRSFERSKNASNVRINEVVLQSATPAIDRARAKLSKLFQDPTLPRATPTDDGLYAVLTNSIDKYTFGDETKLKLTQDKDELQTAWMYPVDTNNNGKFDSYTLYGIYFKNPPVSGGQYTRARNPLEARTPPMAASGVNGACADTLGTSATLVGSTGWFNINGKLKKSFFTYTATVPITSDPTDTDKYEKYNGNKGFSAIEYQQDRVQLPLVNNAIIYEDDLALTPGPPFKLNGRIYTNSNFITGGNDKTDIELYQVSSVYSCFYEADNGKISVGGNVTSGALTSSTTPKDTLVHLYKGQGVEPTAKPKVTTNKSVTEASTALTYNSLAYVQRINRLVDAQIATGNADPQEVTDGITKTKAQLNLASYTSAEEAQIRRQQLELYFKKRTRRVPYAEVPLTPSYTSADALSPYATSSPLEGSGDSLRPKDDWAYPTDPADGITGTNYADLTLNKSSDKLIPGATEPTQLEKDGVENSFGDRVLIGNNLPQLWWDKNKQQFVGPDATHTQDIKDIKWDKGTGTRTRRSRVEQLADLGATDRDKDWEIAAAKVPTSLQDPVGGLRVVTGTGIYLPPGYTTSGVTGDTDFAKALAATKDIWSDLMPVASDTATTASTTSNKYSYLTLSSTTTIAPFVPYLRMRATAVYHYNTAKYDEKAPKPIACVSSYYDPTDEKTAKNLSTLPFNAATGGNSNNGVVYPAPTKTVSDYQKVLDYQKELKYPNGRLVNELLKNALGKTSANRTLSEQSAIDAALCALEILDGSTPSNSVIPHGAIMETAFLDGRQIKAVDSSYGSKAYNLAVNQRQPLEIRATVLDINLLRQKTISGGSSTATEYLIPNSGIIYATRDDALLDLSSTTAESPVDFILDPTRRPNAIMLTNGAKIWRENIYRDAEKGLILASNLPVYVKGNFNLHTQEEFTEKLKDDWTNFYTRAADKRNPQFACRKGDTRLPNCDTGDEWRPASVIADAVTLLSDNFRFGYRNEGDYDINDNRNLTTNNGASTNYLVTNFEWYDSTGIPKDFDSVTTGNQGSSYLNNFVTPIQRRAKFPEYLMEVCPKLPATACTANDWVVIEGQNAWNISNLIGRNVSELESGTTARPPAAKFAKFPRRVAFKRTVTTGILARDTAYSVTGSTNKPPIPLGIKNGLVQEFPYSAWDKSNSSTQPDMQDTALWFRTTTSTNNTTNNSTSSNASNDADLPLLTSPIGASITANPSLTQVVQLSTPLGTPQTASSTNLIGYVGNPPSGKNEHNNWLQIASENTFNLITAAGDTPARYSVDTTTTPSTITAEDNGGVHNFVRFLENWNPTGPSSDAIKARISGAFIQFKRSAYATAPIAVSFANNAYRTTNNSGRSPFYMPPTRQWGYDVALLSQSPDLFAQKLVRTPDDLPDEFFREVGRDDAWVQTLLCAKKAADGTSYAIDKDQRPASCQS